MISNTDCMVLDDSELLQINGGGWCLIMGIGLDCVACWDVGTGLIDPGIGTGATACWVIGVGAGYVF